MNKEPYLVTVAIALYNCEKYISRALISILKQTYKQIEIIVINDGSTDSSLDKAKDIKVKYDKENKIKIYTKENGGLSSARNYAIEKSRGEFLLLMDSDDWLESDAIFKLVDAQLRTNSDIVKMNYVINKSGNKDLYIKNPNKFLNQIMKLPENKIEIAKDIINGNITSYTWSMLIRKEIITREFYFEKNVHLEDKIFLLKILNNSRSIYFLNEVGYHYFININGLMHNKTYDYYLQKDIEMNKRIEKIIKDYYDNNNTLFQVNNTMTCYGIERNLFNIYLASNKDKTIDNYIKIEKYWNNIKQNIDTNFLEESSYAFKNDYFLNLWNDKNFSKIFRIYRLDKIKYKIKEIIKKIIRR